MMPVRSLMPVLLGLSLALAAAPAPARDAPARAAAGKAAAVVPQVTEPWVAEAPPGARHGAAYLVLRNGARADTLLEVTTPVAEVVELHEMRMEGGLMRMRQDKSVDLAPGAELRLAPGGRHLMLVNLKRPLVAGEQVPLQLRFRRAGRVTVQAPVRALAPADEEAGASHAH